MKRISKENLKKRRKEFNEARKKFQKKLHLDVHNFKRIKTKDVVVFSVLLISVIVFIWFLRIYSPENIVEFIGVENVYIVTFLFALFGGVSFLTAAYFYATYAIFVLGGFSPWTLAIFAAAGLTIGDLFFYYLGLKGSVFTKNYFSKPENIKKLEWFERKIEKREFLFIYLYAGFAPFPKDILSFALGIFNRKVKRIVLPLFLGNFTYNVIIGYLIIWGLMSL